MIRYSLTIALSAFLLFQIQPMMARAILPQFGGTAAVWTTCMMFFQVVLLLGYLYAHALRQLFRPATAWLVHGVVLLGAAMALPMANWSGPAELQTGGVAWPIVQLLAVSIGLPFFALATTGPLIQAWQATSHPRRSPYRLYALSNAGSVLALVSYPFLVERWLTLGQQYWIWTLAFVIFAVLCFGAGRQAVSAGQWHQEEDSGPRASWGRVPLWVFLPMTASVLFLAITNLMCQEVASIPFLWILPLTLYLLSFIISFDRPTWYRRLWWLPLLAFSCSLAILVVHMDVHVGLSLQVGSLSLACFAGCMVCHGELERTKPGARDLTHYYLWIAVGGAAGGILVSLVAPRVFGGFYEFHLGLMAAMLFGLLAIASSLYGRAERQLLGWRRWGAVGVALTLLTGLAITACSLFYFIEPDYHPGLVFRGRNDYGLTNVVDMAGSRHFVNGRVVHGGQPLEGPKRLQPGSYYFPNSGVGIAFEAFRSQTNEPLHVGVLGLGAGAMATWLEPEDRMEFFEINPMVVDVARTYFTFLDETPGEKSVVLGDGRIALQQILQKEGSREYDLLFMDAFASDSIPVHLLTEECFDLYQQHLKPGGILVVHISNHFIDLLPVVLHQARRLKYEPVLIETARNEEGPSTRWILLTTNQEVLHSDRLVQRRRKIPEGYPSVRWTDDFASVAAQLDWSAAVDWNAILDTRVRQRANADTSEKQRSEAPDEEAPQSESESETTTPAAGADQTDDPPSGENDSRESALPSESSRG